MLPALNQTQKIVLTRKQIFILIASMFLCIIPPQMNNKLVSFIDLMTTRSMDDVHKQKPIIRLEKLKCVINYLQYMCDVEDIYD